MGGKPARAGTPLYLCCETVDPDEGDPSEPLPLEIGDIVIIGRSPETADLVLPSQKVSRQHAEIERTTTGVTIRDMGSRNGTYVGGEQIDEGPTELLCGKSVLVGAYRLFVAGERAAFAKPRVDENSSGVPSTEDYLRASAQDTNV